LLSGGASSLIAITSVGVINSRHLLYGAVLSEYLNKLSLIKKLFISYFIVDQGFAVSNIYFKNESNLLLYFFDYLSNYQLTSQQYIHQKPQLRLA